METQKENNTQAEERLNELWEMICAYGPCIRTKIAARRPPEKLDECIRIYEKMLDEARRIEETMRKNG